MGQCWVHSGYYTADKMVSSAFLGIICSPSKDVYVAVVLLHCESKKQDTELLLISLPNIDGFFKIL